MTFLYKSKDGVVNLAGLVISATTGVELAERIAELDAKVGKLLTRSEIKYATIGIAESKVAKTLAEDTISEEVSLNVIKE